MKTFQKFSWWRVLGSAFVAGPLFLYLSFFLFFLWGTIFYLETTSVVDVAEQMAFVIMSPFLFVFLVALGAGKLYDPGSGNVAADFRPWMLLVFILCYAFLTWLAYKRSRGEVAFEKKLYGFLFMVGAGVSVIGACAIVFIAAVGLTQPSAKEKADDFVKSLEVQRLENARTMSTHGSI